MKVHLERLDQDYLFEVANANGHRVLLDNRTKTTGAVKGISPMELLLMGLAGCSSIDIVAILRKQKIELDDIQVSVEGFRPEGAIPALFRTIEVQVQLQGSCSPEKALRAVKLSFDKYCSVSKTLEPTAEIYYTVKLNGTLISNA